ncbi:murein hydrolase activator EnvC family protein [Camelliibacillus cellulosilyticus]|uniref:Murein hydrolase activator EnvC family protein n=1 Tax=Camelliibacillus cellulosilyticus TaxID=2174486 RepID=A0ABV9GN46_9BACL
MQSRWQRTILAVGLSAVTATSLVASGTAHADSEAKMKQRIHDLQNKQEQKKAEINQAKGELSANKSKQQNLGGQIDDLAGQISQMAAKIEAKQKDIDATNSQIDALKKNIHETIQRIERRDQILKERVRAMYINNGGSVDYIQVLLGAKDFGDFVTRVFALNQIADQDNRLLNAQKADKAKLEDRQKEVQEKLLSLKQDMSELNSMKQTIDAKKAEKERLLGDLKKQGTELQETVMSKQEEAENIAAQKAAAQKALELYKKQEAERQAAQKRAQEQAKAQISQSSGGGGHPSTNHAVNTGAILQWPVSGSISSGYGYRSYGGGGFHPGIDIAGPTGTPVHAAAAGVVFRSYRSSSYGNVVMITHYIGGQQYTTVYAHLNSRSVSDNQVVQAGQVIGARGSTGDSSGPHLHFEVYRGEWTRPPHPGTINPLSVLP